MKSTFKVALLATVLMAASPVLAHDDMQDTTTKYNNQRATPALDKNGNPMPVKHWHHKRSNMDNKNYVNHDANPNYGAVDAPHGYRDANGNWHRANGYRDTNGNLRDSNGRIYAYNERSGEMRWMGMDLDTRHMTDGADIDVNNRGRHAFIFDNGQNSQDFRVGSGHVVKH